MLTAIVCWPTVRFRLWQSICATMLSADSFKDYEDMIFGMDDGPVRVIGTVVWFQAANEME